MFRALLSSRMIQVGLVFFVVVVSGSLLYSWQTRRAPVAEFTRTDVVPHETRSEQDTVDTSTVDFEQSETPLEVDDLQKSEDTDVAPIDEISEMLEMADAFLPDDMVSEEALAEDLPVSPFGFGPYPEIPEDYPENLIPPWANGQDNSSGYASGNELLDRVLVKLWTHGDKAFIGGSTANGKVYPHYPNTAYVRYKEFPLADGTVHRRITRIKGGPDLAPYAEQIREGTQPAHIQLLDLDTSGIDPYTFLNTGD